MLVYQTSETQGLLDGTMRYFQAKVYFNAFEVNFWQNIASSRLVAPGFQRMVGVQLFCSNKFAWLSLDMWLYTLHT